MGKSIGKRFIIPEKELIEILYKILLTAFIVINLMGATYARSLLFIDLSVWRMFVKGGIPFLLLLLYLYESKVLRVTRKEFIVELFVISLLLLSFIFAHSSTLFVSILFIITYPKSLDSKKLAKYVSIVFIIFIIYILINAFCGLLPDISEHRGVDSMRHSMGFVGANALGNTISICLMIYFYGKIDNWKFADTVIFTIILCLSYTFIISRMGGFIILLMVLIGIFYEKIKTLRIANIVYLFASWLFPVFFLMTYSVIKYMQANSNSEAYIFLNSMFSGRIGYGIYYLETYGFSVFGQKIETTGIYEVMTQGETWMGLDSSYLMIPIHFGIVFLVLFCVGYYVLGKRLRANGDIAGAFITILFLIYGITENYLFGIHYNFSMILLAYELFARKRIQNEWISNSGEEILNE